MASSLLIGPVWGGTLKWIDLPVEIALLIFVALR